MVKIFFKSFGLLLAVGMFAMLVSNLTSGMEHTAFQWAGKNYDSSDIKTAFRRMPEPMAEKVEAEYYAAREIYFEANNLSFYERNKHETLSLIMLLGLLFVGWKIKKWIDEANKNMVD
jgi:hypothetical protein